MSRALAVLAALLCAAPLAAPVGAQAGEDPGRAPRHGVGVSYGYVHFLDELEPWHLASVTLRGGAASGSLIGRVNYADRFGERGTQLEVDAYPRFRGGYAYLNAGYAPDGLFPEWRVGGELFASLPGSWEASAGARHLRFEASEVTLYTGSVGKYAGNYWLSLRSYARPEAGSVSASASLTARRYLADADQYVGASVGYGSTPSDRLTPQELERTSSLTAGLQGSRRLGRTLVGVASLGYEREELSADRDRVRWELSTGLELDF